MSGKFEHKPFAQINLGDPFFDSLKRDYPEFEPSWFPRGIQQGRVALVFSDENGLGAFIALKTEDETIQLVDGVIPARHRLKVSTLRLAERFRGQRLGEGALGLILWEWQRSKLDEIYVTVFPQHDDLIMQLERFGFLVAGQTPRGELVYMRSRSNINFSDPYKAFPFISPNFRKGGYILVEDSYHDTLFPYSDLKNTMQEQLDRDAANGISKVYIGGQWAPHYQRGEPVFIYRKYNGANGKPRYKSCVTSFCVVNDVIFVKRNNTPILTFDEFCLAVGNKSVFTKENLWTKYQNDKNITIVRMLYCGYFGSGNNVNMDWLDTAGLWTPDGGYPANTQLSQQQCATIWIAGGIDVDNVLGM